MNITLLVNWDSASAYALSLLAPYLNDHKVSVFYTQKPSRLKVIPKDLTLLAEFEANKLEKQQAIFEQLNAQKLNDINGEDFQIFADSQPDLVASIRHMSILKSKVINTPKHGIINLHSGLLPSYQGVMATFWAMKNKEKYIGSTLHWIEDASIDTGSIIAQSTELTRFDQSYYSNVLNIYQAGCDNILSAIGTLDSGNSLNSIPQSKAASYYSFPTNSDFEDFEYTLF